MTKLPFSRGTIAFDHSLNSGLSIFLLMNLSQVKPPVRKHPAACPADAPLQYKYNTSTNGLNLNLLILLHGFGDSLEPFIQLGKSLNLPQTSTIAVQGPHRLPSFIIENGYQWHESLDIMKGGEPLSQAKQYESLQSSLTLLQKFTDEVVFSCGYEARNVFILGFAQGATMAIEWVSQLSTTAGNIGGLILIDTPSVLGPLTPSSTPTLICRHGDKSRTDESIASTHDNCIMHTYSSTREASMPAGREEWTPIFTFFGKELGRFSDMGKQVYEVRTK